MYRSLRICYLTLYVGKEREEVTEKPESLSVPRRQKEIRKNRGIKSVKMQVLSDF